MVFEDTFSRAVAQAKNISRYIMGISNGVEFGISADERNDKLTPVTANIRPRLQARVYPMSVGSNLKISVREARAEKSKRSKSGEFQGSMW